MKKQIKELAKKERKLEHKVHDLKKRIQEIEKHSPVIEKLSPVKEDSIVGFTEPLNKSRFTKEQRELLQNIDEKIVDMLISTEDALNYKPKRK